MSDNPIAEFPLGSVCVVTNQLTTRSQPISGVDVLTLHDFGFSSEESRGVTDKEGTTIAAFDLTQEGYHTLRSISLGLEVTQFIRVINNKPKRKHFYSPPSFMGDAAVTNRLLLDPTTSKHYFEGILSDYSDRSFTTLFVYVDNTRKEGTAHTNSEGRYKIYLELEDLTGLIKVVCVFDDSNNPNSGEDRQLADLTYSPWSHTRYLAYNVYLSETKNADNSYALADIKPDALANDPHIVHTLSVQDVNSIQFPQKVDFTSYINLGVVDYDESEYQLYLELGFSLMPFHFVVGATESRIKVYINVAVPELGTSYNIQYLLNVDNQEGFKEVFNDLIIPKKLVGANVIVTGYYTQEGGTNKDLCIHSTVRVSNSKGKFLGNNSYLGHIFCIRTDAPSYDFTHLKNDAESPFNMMVSESIDPSMTSFNMFIKERHVKSFNRELLNNRRGVLVIGDNKRVLEGAPTFHWVERREDGTARAYHEGRLEIPLSESDLGMILEEDYSVVVIEGEPPEDCHSYPVSSNSWPIPTKLEGINTTFVSEYTISWWKIEGNQFKIRNRPVLQRREFGVGATLSLFKIQRDINKLDSLQLYVYRPSDNKLLWSQSVAPVEGETPVGLNIDLDDICVVIEGNETGTEQSTVSSLAQDIGSILVVFQYSGFRYEVPMYGIFANALRTRIENE